MFITHFPFLKCFQMSLTFKYYLFTKQLADLVVLTTHAGFGLATDNTPRLHRCFISLTWDHFQNSRARQESHSPVPGTQPVSQHWVNMTHSESKLQGTKHLMFSLSFSVSLSMSLHLSLSERNMDALALWAQSLLERVLREPRFTCEHVGRNVSHTWIFSGLAACVRSIGHH